MKLITWLNTPITIRKPRRRWVVGLAFGLQALAAYGRAQRNINIEKRLKALEGRKLTKVKLTDKQSAELRNALKGVVDDARVKSGE